MFRGLYNWTMRLAARPDAVRAMAVVSFSESSFFPIPPDVVLVPLVLAQRAKAFLIAAVCTVSSVLGGLAGYAIGYYLLETVGLWLLQAYGLEEGLAQYRTAYAEWGLWIILIKGLTPIPYKLVTIASGAAQFDLLVFVLASIVTRGARFYLLAALLWRFGEPIRAFIEKWLDVLGVVFVVALVGGFVAVRYVF
ncbi:MAG: DedA family protein [Alphaproteobacteria bacterium]|nr:DedA family protein [Alphaproteobacteria bacterium]